MSQTRDIAARQICIHGHFYQPPRENPWLEHIERQPSAAPYHDWNARIAHECYAANAAARILDDDGYIVDIVNNYERISFNIGPTLMEWLRTHKPRVYEAILRADRRSVERNAGHGNAIAQAYSHMIMPLANMRDRRTQVEWGIRDFERHFDRHPEGMWLPETAVDIDTLEALAEHEIRFTILAPRQAESIRALNSGDEWADATPELLDTTVPYRQSLPSGRSIDIFFYDDAISHGVAFDQLLERGEFLSSRLEQALRDVCSPQLVHIATDGETYGHHHRHGEMALAFALREIQRDQTVSLTNYGRFLAENPPRMEVRVVDHSSWSCVHGVERWQSDCGCQTGGPPEWSQGWRAPLRRALDTLRDDLSTLFESRGEALFVDPWRARDAYFDLVYVQDYTALRRGVSDLLLREQPTEADVTLALQLLEIERQAMLMFTSCGWFFNDVAGIETIQILRYAGRAMELADRVSPDDARRERFLSKLSDAKSNTPDISNAREVFDRHVTAESRALSDVARHFSIIHLFQDAVPVDPRIPFARDVAEDVIVRSAESRLAAGTIEVRSLRTLESDSFIFIVAYLGAHQVIGGLAAPESHRSKRLFADARSHFEAGDQVELKRWFDNSFEHTFDLRALLGDAQQDVVRWLLESVVADATELHAQIYRQHTPLLRFLARTSTEPPQIFKHVAESVLNDRLEALFTDQTLSPNAVGELLSEFEQNDISIDETRLREAVTKRLERETDALRDSPASVERAVSFAKIIAMAQAIPVEVSLWDARNICFVLLRNDAPGLGPTDQDAWRQALETAAGQLQLRVIASS